MNLPASGEDPIRAMLRFGLARAIQIHSETFRAENPGLTVDLDLVDDEGLLPEAPLHALFRVYREAMSNIERHARAGRVWVRYAVTGEVVLLEIRDDGQGFSIPADWAKFASTSRGVMGMKARLEALGGALHITSQPGQGTKIEATLPLLQDGTAAGAP
jgi:signal transduction histidine kinase